MNYSRTILRLMGGLSSAADKTLTDNIGIIRSSQSTDPALGDVQDAALVASRLRLALLLNRGVERYQDCGHTCLQEATTGELICRLPGNVLNRPRSVVDYVTDLLVDVHAAAWELQHKGIGNDGWWRCEAGIYSGTVQYTRKPTPAEIKFGYGATHYLDIPIRDVLLPTGEWRKRVNVDGLIYT